MRQQNVAGGEGTGKSRLAAVCLWLTAALAAAPAHAGWFGSEKDPCLARPDALCLTEMAEDAMTEVEGFTTHDALYQTIGQNYLREGELGAADANIRKILDLRLRTPAAIEIATRYAQNGQNDAAQGLFLNLREQLQDEKALPCRERLPLLYQAVQSTRMLYPGSDVIESTPMPSMLREALYLTTMQRLLKEERIDAAKEMIATFQDPAMRDEAVFLLVEYGIKKLPLQTLQPFLDKVSSPEQRRDFMDLRLPAAYLRHGNYESAIDAAHGIPDLLRKCKAFAQIVKTLTENHNFEQARRVVRFNHDFAKLLKNPEDRYQAMLDLAERYRMLDLPRPSHQLILQAIEIAHELPLEKRAAVLNQIMDKQVALKDLKGMRATALDAVKRGYLDAFDEVPNVIHEPELIARLDHMFALLDQNIIEQDRYPIILAILEIQQDELRWRLMGHLKKLRFSTKIKAKKETTPFEVVVDAIGKYATPIDRAFLEGLMGGLVLRKGEVKRAHAYFSHVRDFLQSKHIPSALPGKVLAARKDEAWRVLALEQLLLNQPAQALQDYKQAASEDPDKDFWLTRLIHHNGVEAAIRLSSLDHVVTLADSEKSFRLIAEYINADLDGKRRENFIHLLKATYATGKWGNAYQVMTLIQKFDDEHLVFVWRRIIRPQEQALIPIFVRGYLANGQASLAAQWAAEIDDPKARAESYLAIAESLPHEKQSAPLPELAPLDESVLTRVCGPAEEVKKTASASSPL